jgi:hypothetical protein
MPEETDKVTDTESSVSDESTIESTTVEAKRHVCDACFLGNLTYNVNVKECIQCSELHCLHFTSRIDPTHCIHCLHDVTVVTETISKTQEYYNENKDKVGSHTRKAKRIMISGMDWLFQQRKIIDLTDAELDLAIQYHRSIYDGMMYEREKRRAEHLHRNQSKSFRIPTSKTNDVSIGETLVTSTTEVKKTRTVRGTKPNSDQTNLESAIKALMGMGLSLDDITKQLLKK